MLSNKDLFNGMRLIKAVGIDQITQMQEQAEEINASESNQEEKLKQASGMMMNFMLESVCNAEVELKKLLAGWKDMSFSDIDKTSADEFIDIIEEFISTHTVVELGDFFKRVLGLISQMR